jgi:hypothetical protein
MESHVLILPNLVAWSGCLQGGQLILIIENYSESCKIVYQARISRDIHRLLSLSLRRTIVLTCGHPLLYDSHVIQRCLA